MSFSQPHRYKLYIPSYWADNENAREYRCDVMMSSMPSREDILNELRKVGELEGYSQDYIDGLHIDRPDGWYYKKILIYSVKTDKRVALWQFVPSP